MVVVAITISSPSRGGVLVSVLGDALYQDLLLDYLEGPVVLL
jgi:hypothetical protein